MIWIWAVAIIILAMLTKLWTNQLLKQHAVIRAQIIVTISCIVQIIFIYFFMIELIHHLVQGLRVFYH
ncbi:hypothetical protein OXR01_12405 [Staphylococcus gallinarum]|jgi:ABC-type amino acid transport system permease subunit|uniref:Uncharacterized protein n=1 Tax=Staphylococcus gallinarum TaxID=1293 RepID=A0A0D0SPT1_STAGA|nr:hypothetical protein [Staphylococcus gallinarum]KIR12488.1 hypothetical protein SH09_03250 [Staphylococcus gallinarum]MBU7218695.1 hypothetical protein [Staphylococcus gallinarum]MCD8786441.1 hypothetical protein [Staphylococcus gallinarum]MCD8794087.1 hypothetical protein [Staphylococcus gallinarum]MCD8830247.1 hypothetical protein [Staphylococcus gallinarum]